jgi:hypothetical protein
VSVLLAACLGGWLGLSIVRYVPRVGEWLDRHDLVFLVPHWSFFAPHPNRTDYYLYVRIGHERSFSPWRELRLGPDRPWHAAVWNPARRTRKALIDLCQALLVSRGQPRALILLGMPYLLLLTTAQAAVARAPATVYQFAVVGLAPRVARDAPFLYFVSDVHSL